LHLAEPAVGSAAAPAVTWFSPGGLTEPTGSETYAARRHSRVLQDQRGACSVAAATRPGSTSPCTLHAAGDHEADHWDPPKPTVTVKLDDGRRPRPRSCRRRRPERAEGTAY
jgi:hypothetical protein